MNEQERGEGAHAALETEIGRLKEHAATSVSPCAVAKLIAVSDEQVLERLRARLRNGDVPRSVRCLGTDGVLFAFDCAPGAVCLVPRSLLVRVDLDSRKVREIVDPFDPDEAGHVQSATVMPSTSLHVTHAAPALGATTATGAPIRMLSRPVGLRAPVPTLVGAPSASASLLAPVATLEVGESFMLTVEVTGVSFKALLFGSMRFDFFDNDRLDVTLPTAGTYQFDLMVRDFAHRTFKFKVSTSTGASFEQSAETDSQGGNLLRLQVTVP